MKIIKTVFLSGVVFLSACSDDSTNKNNDTLVPDKTKEPTESPYSNIDCPMDLPEDETVECGVLKVPESRVDFVNSKEITMSVAIIRSHNSDFFGSASPILYLHGGPGGTALKGIKFYASIFEEEIKTRDLILVDQRGNGFSSPNLRCPEVDEDYRNQFYSDVIEPDESGLMRCLSRLESEGINVPSYNLKETIADLADLKSALNINEWNLYGTSYGTMVAQAMMEKHPDGIRSVVLDSVATPVDNILNPSAALKFQESFDKVFALCESQEICEERYPDLQLRFWNEVEFRNQSPAEENFVVAEYEIDIDIGLTGNDFIAFAQNLFEQPRSRASFPKAIDELIQGDYTRLLNDVRDLLGDSGLSVGTLYSTLCAQTIYDDSTLELLDDLPVNKYFVENEESKFKAITSNCEKWPHDKDSKINVSNYSHQIPVLSLAGEFDIRTPSTDADYVASLYNVSYYFEIPDTGHGVLFNDCARSISHDFIRSPQATPDSSCIDSMGELTLFKPGALNIDKSESIFKPDRNPLVR